MVKAGVYLVGRLRPLFVGPEAPAVVDWTLVFASLGLLTMTVAAVLAVSATDIKELLAYSTASHLGLIVAGFGFADVVGAETGAFHVLNHASFKAALFLVAGIVSHEVGTRRIDALGGLRRHLPVTAAVATVASLSMAGLPPFNGFYSKELLFEAAWKTAAAVGGLAWAFPVVAVLGSVFTFLYSIRFLWLFWGPEPDGMAEAAGHGAHAADGGHPAPDADADADADAEPSAGHADHERGHDHDHDHDHDQEHGHEHGSGIHRPPAAMAAPAAVLGVLVVAISAAPNAFIDGLIGDTLAATVAGEHAFPSLHLPTPGDVVSTPYVTMSAITVGLGIVASPFYGRLHGLTRAALRGPARANWWYDGGVDGLTDASVAVVPRIHTGLLRTYAIALLGGVVVLALGGYAAAGVGVQFPSLAAVVPSIPIAVVLLIAVVGVVAVGRAPSHVAGVLALSILGFMIAIFYILADAPDLALTQLVIETLVLVIFLLVLNRLPAFYGDVDLATSIRDGVLATLVGATVFVTVLVTTAASPSPLLRESLLARAGVPAEHEPSTTILGLPAAVVEDFGGGGNVVNVILVDFRAFDTLGEISVVAMAALAVITLIRMRERGETQ
jgi:multicomponent Na+:H+ antiporter subunit A